jgi:hypothetical protein
MKPNSRVTSHGNNAGILTTRNPLCWDRGSPLGLNSRPRDTEDAIVFDALDDIVGLTDLGAAWLPASMTNPLSTVTAPITTPLNNMFAAPKMIGIGAAVGLVGGLIIGYMVFKR